ncbi:thioesterase family protein [Mycolicibacterium flavescens]|uniref:Thioesterase n=1 Tax=Mycolicibacterium flavescens TaxID=1776 RepID=A0A1E3RIG7_MYCFV|nr:thioesterase family protein [Mycolicibacterium flavescens]MCV7282274.1 thioesterase family protein [Mycolicibacterium flavescens]ODQ89658.1 thioesterase [Mycolicibacterium flavescens]
MLDGRDFAFDGGSTGEHTSRFGRDLPEHWCFDGRAFGGYTSALALAAVFAHSGRAAAASLSVTFVEGGAPGPVEIDVRTLRGGRTAAVYEATVSQAGRTILIASSWLADGWLNPPSVDAPIPFERYPSAELPDPASSPSLDWISQTYRSLQFAHRRGVDYPSGLREFGRHHPEVALWVAADCAPDEPQVHPQVVDVLHADAHLFDAPGKVSGFGDTWLLSLDLSLVWQPGAHLLASTSWRLLEARGSVADGACTAYGSLRGPDGALLAVLTSQGLVR